jgi:hypothetical protein
MNKALNFVVLALLLMVFPIVSYFYLNKGITFRKEIIKELSIKTPLGQKLMSADSLEISFKGKGTLVVLDGKDSNLKTIYSQFKEAKGFQLLSNIENMEISKLLEKPNEDLVTSTHKQLDSSSHAYLMSKFPKATYLLVDSLSQVRLTYNSNPSELARLALHITTVLPYYDEKRGR